MSRKNRLILFLVSILLFLSVSVFGQRSGGSIEGTVKDAQGAVIPNASVTVNGINIGFNRTIQSDENGAFKMQQVPPGNYKITVAPINGFSERTVEVLVVIEKTASVDIELAAGPQAVNVEVGTDPIGVNVDSTDSKIQTNITANLIESLPKFPGLVSLLRISPATRQEARSGGFQVDGASGSENAFSFDGQEVTDYRTGALNISNSIPTNLIQEVQIKTSGFEAEFGGASGGVVAVSTKGGSNRWSGEFGTQFDVAKFQAQTTRADAVFQPNALTQQIFSLQQPKDGGINSYPTATVSGPILRGKLWGLGSYSPQIFQTSRDVRYLNSNPTTLTVNPAFPNPERYEAKNTFNFGFARIDAEPLQNVRVFASFLWNPLAQEGLLPFAANSIGGRPTSQVIGGTTFTGAALAAQQGGRINQNLFTTQGTWTPNGRTVVSVRYGRGFANQKLASYAIPNETTFQCRGLASSVALTNGSAGCGLGFNSNTGNLANNGDVNIRNTVNADVSYVVNLGGSHNFKGGYEYTTVENDVSFGRVNTGIVQLQYGRDFSIFGVGGSCAAIQNCIGVGILQRNGTDGSGKGNYNAFYLQDKWQPIRNLTLNLGVRAEKEDVPSFNTATGSGQPISFGFGDKIAPRFGGAYDPFGDGKTRIFGSFGLFYDRLRFDLPRGSFGGDFFRQDFFPILSTNPQFSFYTPARILGSFTDPIGGGNPSTRGGLSIFQVDFRIPSNISAAEFTALGLPIGGVDPDLKPFTQSEFTVGIERELSRMFILSARFTRKNVEDAIEDQANLGTSESESYIIGNPGRGFAFEQRQAAGYIRQAEAQRLYNGVEIIFTKRLSSNYYYSANYTYSHLEGNYSGLASSDEGGRTSPGVNRFFDYVNNGFTALGTPDNGVLETDRPHYFKAYGGYTFDWFKSKSNATDVSFFTTITSGQPNTTFLNVGQTSVVRTERNDLGRSPVFSSSDLAFSHKYRFGSDNRYKVVVDVNFINVFNQNGVTSLNTLRYLNNNGLSGHDLDPCYDIDGIRPSNCPANLPVRNTLTVALNNVLNGQAAPLLTALDNEPGNRNVLYGRPAGFQAPRNVRFGFRFIF
jgi:Carboxypeptidase regulatory-like domain/TonB-dependent Receptor Plug Domain